MSSNKRGVGRGGGGGRFNQGGHYNKSYDRNDRSGWNNSAPAPPAAPEMDTDPTPILSATGDFTYPTLTVKAAQALRAMRSGLVDDMTKPILAKWEERLRSAIKLNTVMPDPPNWQTAAPRTSGWGGSGFGTGAVAQVATGMPAQQSLDTNAFLSKAAQNTKKKGKNTKKDTGYGSALQAPVGMRKTGAGDADVRNLQERVMRLERENQQLREDKHKSEELFKDLQRRFGEREATIRKLEHYLQAQGVQTQTSMLLPQQFDMGLGAGAMGGVAQIGNFAGNIGFGTELVQHQNAYADPSQQMYAAVGQDMGWNAAAAAAAVAKTADATKVSANNPAAVKAAAAAAAANLAQQQQQPQMQFAALNLAVQQQQQQQAQHPQQVLQQ